MTPKVLRLAYRIFHDQTPQIHTTGSFLFLADKQPQICPSQVYHTSHTASHDHQGNHGHAHKGWIVWDRKEVEMCRLRWWWRWIRFWLKEWKKINSFQWLVQGFPEGNANFFPIIAWKQRNYGREGEDTDPLRPSLDLWMVFGNQVAQIPAFIRCHMTSYL